MAAAKKKPRVTPAPKGATRYPDRVKGLAWLPGSRVEPAPKNWRTHDDKQRAALRGLLTEIGVAGAVLVWVPDQAAREALRTLPASTGAAALIDGYRVVGCEKTGAYAAISRGRLRFIEEQTTTAEPTTAEPTP